MTSKRQGKDSDKKANEEDEMLPEELENEIGNERNMMNKKISKHMLMEDNFIGHLPKDV